MPLVRLSPPPVARRVDAVDEQSTEDQAGLRGQSVHGLALFANLDTRICFATKGDSMNKVENEKRMSDSFDRLAVDSFGQK